jgi:hypothetical protein
VHGAILELHLKEENSSRRLTMRFARILDSGTSLVIMEQLEEQMEQVDQAEQIKMEQIKIPDALTQATCTSALPTDFKLT